ncbi:septum formation family protein [Corynebacterium alimapuense]|uniref:Septum formation-related domain-containing protein n=1 Tax=Corynebacterium alimapuense TaxID=1576874 RepID=A0A3M8KB36_9CORY|nr:septum formation family protein [Corynebacterium alimapuense]RNE50005.1 hypothetical protein C5L39_01135 [Corynebacterium alimapuense]
MKIANARSATAVRAGLVAAMATVVALGAHGYVSAANQDNGVDGQSAEQSDSSEDDAQSSTLQATPFTTADVGDCLTWNTDEAGVVSDFEQVPCSGEHRFEISAREDLAAYPSSEFGPDASVPDVTRQAQLREELCAAPTLRYLDGRFDPVGRFSIAPILPSAEAWTNGDRTMLCGLQSTDADGIPIPTIGPISTQDQARVNQPEACVAVDSSRAWNVVDCTEPHQMETTLIVDLLPIFPEGTPTIEDQDGHLAEVCTQAAQDYLGGEEELYQSTLQAYWGTIDQSSWIGGSHSVNCSLVHANEEGGFSTLEGTARDGRDGFTINGQPPAEQPTRDPLVETG